MMQSILLLSFWGLVAPGLYNEIAFEKTPYGLIFTEIQIDGKPVKAMIDFGDPNSLMLSFSLSKSLHLKMKNSGLKMADIQGNQYVLMAGTVENIQIGKRHYENLNFLSAEGEMEKVSQQIGTEFNAVIGFGYLSRKPFVLDYELGKIQLFEGMEHQHLKCSFDQSQGYFVIPMIVNGQKMEAMIDTGSPVSVVDHSLKKEFQNQMISICGIDFEQRLLFEDVSQL
jgi:hypothetical protein